MKEKEKKIPMTLLVPTLLYEDIEKTARQSVRSKPMQALYWIVLGRECDQRGAQK